MLSWAFLNHLSTRQGQVKAGHAGLVPPHQQPLEEQLRKLRAGSSSLWPKGLGAQRQQGTATAAFTPSHPFSCPLSSRNQLESPSHFFSPG